jgi:hypothetical protein
MMGTPDHSGRVSVYSGARNEVTVQKREVQLAAQRHRNLHATVAREGYALGVVLDDEKNEPDFVYSVGFPQSLGQPEVIVAGLDSELAHEMVFNLFRQCRAGLTMHDRLLVSDLLADHGCMLRSVHQDHLPAELFVEADWFQREHSGKAITQAFQIVWPSAIDGRFPWDAGFRRTNLQPALYEPRQIS